MGTSWSPAERRFTVGVLGSARLGSDDERWELARRVGAALAGRGWSVMTGGYGGLMEAAASGAASRGGHILGLPMRSWHNLSPNPHASELLWCDSYPERLGHLLDCDAMVALDGGIGTIAELSHDPHPWIHEYFSGVRGRAALDQAPVAPVQTTG